MKRLIYLLIAVFAFYGFAETLILVNRLKPGANNTTLTTDSSGDVSWESKNSAYSGGTGVTVAADGTITNDSPDQTVVLNDGGIAVVSGTYPNYTITVPAEVDGSVSNELQTLTTSGTSSPVFTLSDGGGAITFNGTGGVVLSRTGNTFTIDGSSFGTGTPSFQNYIEDLSSNSTTVTISGFTYGSSDTQVFVDGVLMEEGGTADFTATSTTLTFASSLLSGQKVTVKKLVIS